MSTILNKILKRLFYLAIILFTLFLIFVLRAQLIKSSAEINENDLSKTIEKESSSAIASKNESNFSTKLKETLKYEKLFHTNTEFLVPEPLHSPFNPPTIIENISALPIAYGDFDADKYTDIYMLASNGSTVQLLKGHSCVDGRTVLTFFGSRRCLSLMNNFVCHFDRLIYNLVASDFTGNLYQDLLITLKASNDHFYEIVLVKGSNVNSKTIFNCSQRSSVLVRNAISEPFILDYNGDMISDFIVETQNCSLELHLGGSNDNSLASDSVLCLDQSSIKHLASPHASGFLNLNSHLDDMTPDLFINGQNSFDYIYNIPGRGFIEKRSFNFPPVPKRGQSAFVDINYDGRMEHLVPVCLDRQSFNTCKQPDLMVLNEDSGDWIPVLNRSLPLGASFNRSFSFAYVENVFGYINLAITLHIVDINYDGYPDFATVLLDTQTKATLGAIFLNKEDNSTAFGRIFELHWISDNDTDQDVVMVSMFDIYNNGRSNLLLAKRNRTDSKQITLKPYDYYAEKSLYFSFLRINIISGLCSDKSIKHSCPGHLAFGSTPPGVSVCFDGPFGGEQSCSVQMAQSAHFAMQPPYMIFGLGDTLNVVNGLKVAIANGNTSKHVRQWNEIIPGSKLVIIPYQPGLTDNWELRVFINMSIYSLVALLFLFALSVLLTLAILILHFKEKIEDRVDNQQYRNAWL
ncbi:Histone H4 [Sarcoptes scabiei]|nr:Histone H4 [Sarcoptes scabiei]